MARVFERVFAEAVSEVRQSSHLAPRDELGAPPTLLMKYF
jgi:hypothetical protein